MGNSQVRKKLFLVHIGGCVCIFLPEMWDVSKIDGGGELEAGRKHSLGREGIDAWSTFIIVSKFVIVFSFEVLLVVVIASLLSCENSFGTVCHLSIEYSMGAR